MFVERKTNMTKWKPAAGGQLVLSLSPRLQGETDA
jgi:hypothetical protein